MKLSLKPRVEWKAIWPLVLSKALGGARQTDRITLRRGDTGHSAKSPERLLEIKGITENKLEAIKTSYAESRMLQDLMTLLSPFKITPKTAQKIYQFSARPAWTF